MGGKCQPKDLQSPSPSLGILYKIICKILSVFYLIGYHQNDYRITFLHTREKFAVQWRTASEVMCDSSGVLDYVVCLVDTKLDSAGQVKVFRVKFEKIKIVYPAAGL